MTHVETSGGPGAVDPIAARRGSVAGWIAGAVGVCGWTIGLTIVAAAGGELDSLAVPIVLATLASLAPYMLFVLAVEGVRRELGTRQDFQMTVGGGICVLVGLISLLAKHWIVPLIATRPSLQPILRSTMTSLEIDDVFLFGTLALGSILLLVPLVRLLRVRQRGAAPRTQPLP